MLYQEKLPITEGYSRTRLRHLRGSRRPQRSASTAHDADEVEERLDGRVVAVSVYANSHPEEMMGLLVFYALKIRRLVDFVEARA